MGSSSLVSLTADAVTVPISNTLTPTLTRWSDGQTARHRYRSLPFNRGHRILAARRHKGFTLLEITLASGLMVLLALLLASAWVTAGKSLVD